MMFHLLGITKKQKTWFLNLLIILILLIVEFAIGTYELHRYFPTRAYEMFYTVLASVMILYASFSIKKIIVVAILQVVIATIMSLGMAFLFEVLGRDPLQVLQSPSYSLLGATAGFVLFLCLYLVLKFLKVYKISLGWKGICLFVFGVVSYGYSVAWAFVGDRDYSNFSRWAILTFLAFIGSILPIVGGVGFVLTESKLRENKFRLIESQRREKMQAQSFALQEDHHRQLLKNEEETKRFRHDIKKQVRGILDLLERGKYEEAKTQMEKIAGKIEKVNNTLDIMTGSDFIDANLNDLLKEYKGVNFNSDWMIPSNLRIEPLDLTILVMNLLTNAFEATVRCAEGMRYVKVTVNAQHNFLYLEVENSYDGVLLVKDGEYKSKKGESDFHGYGILNVKTVVDEYNGRLNIESEGEKFLVQVTFGADIYVEQIV